VEWIDLAQDKIQWQDLLNTTINLRDLQKAGKSLTISATISFKRWF